MAHISSTGLDDGFLRGSADFGFGGEPLNYVPGVGFTIPRSAGGFLISVGGLGGIGTAECIVAGGCPNFPGLGSPIPSNPGSQCESGSCGNNLTPVLAGVGGTIACQILEPCGIVEDVALVVVGIGSLAYLVHQFANKG